MEYLFLQEKQYPESVLAKVKSYLVSEMVLADIAASISLGKYLLLGKGEEATGGRDKKSILADSLEALIGAVYLDSDYEMTKNIVMGFFREKIDSAIESGEFFDYKTELQEKTQLLYGTLPEYRLFGNRGKSIKGYLPLQYISTAKSWGLLQDAEKKRRRPLLPKRPSKRSADIFCNELFRRLRLKLSEVGTLSEG